MSNFKNYLVKLNACQSAIDWVGDKTLEGAWSTTDRGDWMLWLSKKSNVDLRTLTKAKVECAKLVKHLMDDERSLKALEIAERFSSGESTREDLDAAAADAADAAADAAAYAYAADAAYAAADAAAAAYAYAAADAAYAYAAADAYTDARCNVLSQAADICRKHIPVSIIQAAMEQQ